MTHMQVIPAEIRDTRTGHIWRFPRALRGKLVSEADAERIYATYCPRFSQAGITDAQRNAPSHEPMRPRGAVRRFTRRTARKPT